MPRTLFCLYSSFLIMFQIAGCRKHDAALSNATPALSHKLITIHENVNGSEQKQNSLGLWQSEIDPSTFILAAARGIGENFARGFRIATLRKDAGLLAMHSYYLPEDYYFQYASCATLDKDENVWIGGDVFGHQKQFGRPFIAKVSKDGNMLWSKAIYDSFPSSRGIGILALKNGDIAFMTYDNYAFCLYRISPAGSILWSKKISSTNNMVFEPSVSTFQYEGYSSSRLLAETSDGNIFFACNSNAPVKGIDCLLKFSAAGNLVFAKSYAWLTYGTSTPPQIIVTGNDTIVYSAQKSTSTYNLTGNPFVLVISADGSVQASKIYNPLQGPGGVSYELNYYNQHIIMGVSRGYEFDMYSYDMSLNYLSGEKTFSNNDYTTETGGICLVDKTQAALYHIMDFAGNLSDGNGFHFMKTDLTSKSCQVYGAGPIPQVLTAAMLTIADIALPVTDVIKSFNEDLAWIPSAPSGTTVSICAK